MKYTVGQKVRATQQVTEGGYGIPGNPEAESLEEKGWIHAEENDEGEVIYVDDADCPTVRFDRTGTASIVGHSEIEAVDAEPA